MKEVIMIETIEQYQLDLFKDPEICRLEAEIAKTKESNNRVRKKLFAENGKKVIMSLKENKGI